MAIVKLFALHANAVRQKHPQSLIEASTVKAKEIHLEILKQPKTTRNGDIIPFTNTNNSNNPIIFPIKQCPTDC